MCGVPGSQEAGPRPRSSSVRQAVHASEVVACCALLHLTIFGRRLEISSMALHATQSCSHARMRS